MEQRFIQHGDNIVTITGNTRCTNGDCPYIKYVGDCSQIWIFWIRRIIS